MAVAAPAGLSAGLLMVLVLRLLTKRRGRDLVVGAISSSVVNGANMGFPIAAYVLGDISHAIPVILFQQAIYTPDRKSTRLNSSHVASSYAVFCLKKIKSDRLLWAPD